MSAIRVIALGAICSLASAESPWPNPVGRTTNHSQADLVNALIERQRLDEAVEICSSGLKTAEPRSDTAAFWSVYLSRVITQQHLVGDQFGDNLIEAAQKPVADLLASYPDHGRFLFLQAQRQFVVRDAVRHAVVVASVNPTTDTDTDQLFMRLSRVTSELKALSEKVDQSHAALDSQALTPANRAGSSDLRRLHQELLVDIVSVALLHTELFPAVGRDYIAAANKANEAADEALLQLPTDTLARREIHRLQVQALMQSQQIDRAELQLGKLLREVGKPVPANVQAIQVRLDLARNRRSVAEKRLNAFYTGSSAPRSIEMDLARLEYLLDSEDPDVGKWLDEIEQRGGPFARRRAEAISLAKLRSTGAAQLIDAALVAAQGQDWLRRGDPLRAGKLLAAAAKAERDPNKATARAVEAAAALIKANRKPAAAQVLAEVALANPTSSKAAATHLQAAHLYVASEIDEAADRIEKTLRATANTWPESKEADQARRWLIKLLAAKGQALSAARVAISIPADQIAPDRLEEAFALWVQALQESAPDQIDDLGRELRDALSSLPKTDAVQAVSRDVAAFLLDEDLLIPKAAAGTETFADALLHFRADPTANSLNAPPDDLYQSTVWRLMRDGRLNALRQQRNARVMNSWKGDDASSIELVERLIWLKQIEQATETANSLAARNPNPGEVLSVAARLFAGSKDSAVRSRAIALWDQIAGGVPRGSQQWHEAKLEAMGLLAVTGRRAEAIRRAKYVLLTSSPKDRALRQRYEAIARAGSSDE